MDKIKRRNHYHATEFGCKIRNKNIKPHDRDIRCIKGYYCSTHKVEFCKCGWEFGFHPNWCKEKDIVEEKVVMDIEKFNLNNPVNNEEEKVKCSNEEKFCPMCGEEYTGAGDVCKECESEETFAMKFG